jgi:N-ethylmaleimide reductase
MRVRRFQRAVQEKQAGVALKGFGLKLFFTYVPAVGSGACIRKSGHAHALRSVSFGPLELPNRILMAPLTRARAGRDAVPTPIMAEYYAQRASAGLIISEATGISREGLGWPNAPGLWNEQQVDGWKPVTDAVHAAGGRIVAQLWHMGRVVHPDLGGGQPLSASVTTAPDHAHTYEGKKPHVEARAATHDDIRRILGDFAKAARNAILAGFDGVQIHAANGYLIDQFLRSSSNLRDDDYGGSIEHRMRFAIQAIQAVAAEIGIERIGVRFSPNILSQGVED